MKILVGCEFSGVIRDAFLRAGHDATSCDLLPTESPGPHIVGDVLKLLDRGWDLAVFNPPCTYLCNSGVRWLSPGGKLDTERHHKMQEACDLFAALYHAPVARVCIENPIMHKYARDYLRDKWSVPTFTSSIQPWQFGHPEIKRTCFWTRNLPPLVPTEIVEGREARAHRASPGPDRWKERSRTLPGIGKAMSAQWSNLLYE